MPDYDRLSVSIKETESIDKQKIQDHVEDSEWNSVSEFIVSLVKGEIEDEDV